MINVKRNKNKVIVGGTAALLALVAVSAYFVSQDQATNHFTALGDVQIDLQEPSWDPATTTDVTPNEEFAKDPQVKNVEDSTAFVFVEIGVPKADVVTSNSATGAKSASAVTQLFQINKTAQSDAADVWTGVDTYNDGAWKLIGTDTTDGAMNYYLYAYATGASMTELAAGATTPKVFESVTFANLVEGEIATDTSFDISVKAFGIQAEDIKNNDTDEVTPEGVWSVLATQGGDTNAAAITGGVYKHTSSLVANDAGHQNNGPENNLPNSEKGE